jgi:hypothetical protein
MPRGFRVSDPTKEAAEKVMDEGYGLQPVHYGNKTVGFSP